MFADIVGFTTMAKHVEPVTVMTFLNDLYTK
jgi:class 3 adenylate cyclase